MTGDPTIDSVLLWLLSGYKLTSPYAVFALAALVRCVIVPIVFSLATWKNIVYNNIETIAIVYASSLVLCITVGSLTNASIVRELLTTFSVAALAVGIHQTQKVVAKAINSPLNPLNKESIN